MDLLDLATDARVRRVTSADAPLPRWIVFVLWAIGLAAMIGPALVVVFAPRTPYQLLVSIPPRVIPQSELPPVEPLKLQALSPDDARSYNAAIAFSTAPNPPAQPFRPSPDPASLARATDCLAAAVYYEAGDDAVGQRAVAQVVLNRARHPAFPKTVCGVVFQGSERSTGCQFTFACDGALARYHPNPDAWGRARTAAAAALNGAVFAPVGLATHYHTDWVAPYWQSSLDKITEVHTHLFYRWTGWWGTPPAFTRQVDPAEPMIAALASLSDAHAAAPDMLAPLVDPAAPPPPTAVINEQLAAGAPAGFDPKPVAGDASSFLVAVPRGLDPALYPSLAAKACADRVTCKFGAWTDAKKVPVALPVEAAQLASMTFSYLRDRGFAYERVLWNCAQVKRADPKQCMKVQVYQPSAPALPAPIASAKPTPTPTPTPTHGPADLGGVRRKGDGPVGAARPTPPPTQPTANRPALPSPPSKAGAPLTPPVPPPAI